MISPSSLTLLRQQRKGQLPSFTRPVFDQLGDHGIRARERDPRLNQSLPRDTLCNVRGATAGVKHTLFEKKIAYLTSVNDPTAAAHCRIRENKRALSRD